MMTLHDKLIDIQQSLDVPKNQYNKFGGYNYRSKEDILNAVKPLLSKHKLSLTITEEIYDIAGIPVVGVYAELSDGEESFRVKGSAGVQLEKKGMDYAQSFGASSSYAGKYALGDKFLLDDIKDPDSTNKNGNEVPAAVQSEKKWLNKGTDDYTKAVKFLERGGTIKELEMKHKISKAVRSALSK